MADPLDPDLEWTRPLTCGYCRAAPATHVVAVFPPPALHVRRLVEVICDECSETARLVCNIPVRILPVAFLDPKHVPEVEHG